MYPVRLGLDNALERIRDLKGEGFASEALVTSVFTLEKLMRRTMRYAIKARGFNNKQADHLLGRGFEQLKAQWDIFDRSHRKLPTLIGQVSWQRAVEAVKMRNAMVHGAEVFSVAQCRKSTNHVLTVIEELHEEIVDSYGEDTWDIQRARSTPDLRWRPPT